MRLFRFLFIILFISIQTLSFAHSFEHGHDEHDHNESQCELCYLKKELTNDNFDYTKFENKYYLAYEIYLSDQLEPNFKAFFYYQRAPPYFS